MYFARVPFLLLTLEGILLIASDACMMPLRVLYTVFLANVARHWWISRKHLPKGIQKLITKNLSMIIIDNLSIVLYIIMNMF